MEKVAIITAASQGMGAATVKRLSKEGYKTALMARSDNAKDLAKEVGGIAFIGTVTSDQDLRSFVDFSLNHYGRIDVVVNNTGHAAKGDLLKLSDDDWKHGFDLLFMNVVRMCRYVTPIMLEQGGGSIINISTFAAMEPSLDFPVSSAVRASLGAYIKLFAEQYGSRGIRINNILPGFIDSYPVTQNILERIPSKRAGSVNDIAGLVSFLASEDSSYITGENIKIDGGLSRAI